MAAQRHKITGGSNGQFIHPGIEPLLIAATSQKQMGMTIRHDNSGSHIKHRKMASGRAEAMVTNMEKKLAAPRCRVANSVLEKLIEWYETLRLLPVSPNIIQSITAPAA